MMLLRQNDRLATMTQKIPKSPQIGFAKATNTIRESFSCETIVPSSILIYVYQLF
jgi:hypothetical protein